MKFSLAVYGAPGDSRCADSALQFAQCLLRNGHELYRVFFYNQGVYNGNDLSNPPQGEPNTPLSWKRFAEEQDIDLVVCIASAMRRGILDENEANRHDLKAFNLSEGFELSGLGQLVDAIMHSDRFMTFGA